MYKLLPVLLFVGLIACKSSKKTEDTITQNNNSQVEIFKGEGRWVWVSSSFIARGMKEPKISNPETRGYKIVLEFRGNQIAIEKNGSEVAMVPYTIENQGEGFTIIQVEIPQDDFPFIISSGPIYIRGNQLIISGGYDDSGEDQTYKREE
jgi:hypothetical protein